MFRQTLIFLTQNIPNVFITKNQYTIPIFDKNCQERSRKTQRVPQDYCKDNWRKIFLNQISGHYADMSGHFQPQMATHINVLRQVVKDTYMGGHLGLGMTTPPETQRWTRIFVWKFWPGGPELSSKYPAPKA